MKLGVGGAPPDKALHIQQEAAVMLLARFISKEAA